MTIINILKFTHPIRQIFPFQPWKKQPGGENFTNNEEVEFEVDDCFDELNNFHYKQGIKLTDEIKKKEAALSEEERQSSSHIRRDQYQWVKVHVPYSPDFAPLDFPFTNLKKQLDDQRLPTMEKWNLRLMAVLFLFLECVELCGDYVEK